MTPDRKICQAILDALNAALAGEGFDGGDFDGLDPDDFKRARDWVVKLIKEDNVPWDKRPARPLAAWKTGLRPGLWRIHWRDDGGSSLAAIGVLSDGRNWIAACNWVSPCEDPMHKLWTNIERAEPIALYADEDKEPE